jgi:mono/diheme cytochrome c family protein
MRQHNWAAELMSLALAEPSDALWAEGAGSLASARLAHTKESDDASVAREIRELEARVDELATKATQTRAGQERARIYGQLISTCGTCHSLNGVVLGPGIPMH